MQEIDEQILLRELKIDAHGVGIPIGAAEIFAKRTVNDVKKSLKSKTKITEKDLKRAVVRELKKYNADLAYVYENRDTIV